MNRIGLKLRVLFLTTIVLVPTLWFFAPNPAQAQLTIIDPFQEARALSDVVKEQFTSSFGFIILNSLINAVNGFAQRIAYDAAVKLSSAGSGQKPLAFTSGFEDYLKDAALDSLTDFLNDFSKQYAGLGLCEPFNPKVGFSLKFGLAKSVQPPKPKCSFNKFLTSHGFDPNKSFSENMSEVGKTLQTGEFLKNISLAYEFGEAPLQAGIEAHFGALSAAAKKVNDLSLERLAGQGFKDLKDPVSGRIRTPSQVISNQIDEQTIRNPNAVKRLTIGGIFSNTDIYKSLLIGVGNVFFSTLTNKLLERAFSKGILSGVDVVCKTRLGRDAFDLCRNAIADVSGGTGGGAVGGAALARVEFASLLTPLITSSENYDPVSELASCPVSSSENRQVFNCAMSQEFSLALQAPSGRGHYTLREAIKEGFINEELPLIPPSDTGKNQDPFCFQKGYCYANLVKLRHFRILPIGWELAASSPENRADNPIRLKDAISAFNNPSSPFYHLVDPEWVLKAPPHQCRARAPGQTLVAANTDERADVCVDAPSCISEDENGRCTSGYGYCTREKNIWRIPGDSCPAHYATCEIYSGGASNTQLNVLSNTVEGNKCTADNVGCRWYGTTFNTTTGRWNSASRIYLNRRAPECKSEAAGCIALEQAATASTRNQMANPSFEQPLSTDATKPVAWNLFGSTYKTDGSNSFDGLRALSVPTTGGPRAEVPVKENTFYTLSFFSRRNGGGTGRVSVDVIGYSIAGDFNSRKPMDQPLLAQPSCSANSTECGFSADDRVYGRFTTAIGYERSSVTFAVPPGIVSVLLVFFSPDNEIAFDLDAVQLEQGAVATAFHENGTDATGQTVRLKAPPDYLNCVGDATDPAACAQYAPVCKQAEVGCEAYTPAGGGAIIPAVVSSRDRCDAQCVGYSTFKQERTPWESPLTDANRFPLYFIPSTARQCSAVEVGCDEFTNVEQVAVGGEAREYFSFLRQCGKPDLALDATFYTWEGSDAAGYQLKSFVFRKDTGTPSGPLYAANPDPTGVLCNEMVYRNTLKTDPAYNPDCREFLDAAGNVFYRLHSKIIISSDQCLRYRKTPAKQSDADNEKDCTASDGAWDTTTKSCTYLGYAPESRRCEARASGCRAFTGNAGANVRLLLPRATFEGGVEGWTGGVVQSNESSTVGGHSLRVPRSTPTAYRPLNISVGGTTNVSLLTRNKSYQLVFWGKGSGKLNIFFAPSTTTTVISDYNYFSKFDGDPATVALGPEWQRFEVGPVFFDREPASTDVLGMSGFAVDSYIDNVEFKETTDRFTLVAGSWRTPASCDQTLGGVPLPQAQLGCSAYTNRAGQTVNLKSFDHLCREEAVGCEAFTDRRGTDSPFVQFFNARCTTIDGSKVDAPADCVHGGKTLCTVAANESFCRFNWEGSLPTTTGTIGTTTGATTVATLSSSAPDTYTVLADRGRFLVNKEQFRCEADAVGCTALGDTDYGKTAKCTLLTACASAGGCDCQVGTPAVTACKVASGQRTCTYGKRGAIEPATTSTVYRKIDPAQFGRTLCNADGLGCDQWQSGAGGTVYFRDPGEQLCEYRERVSVGSLTYNGWFKKGIDEACDPSYVIGGDFNGVWKNSDPGYAGFAGSCPREFAGCTEFVDKADRPAQYPTGTPYYYIKNDKIDAARDECKGQVSRKEGCIVLSDQSNLRQTISTEVSYFRSDKSNGQRIPLVDCSKPAAERDPACNKICSTRVLCVEENGVNTCFPQDFHGYCETNADCKTGTCAEVTSNGVSSGSAIAGNDGNIVLKVVRDRACAEWLTCASSRTVFDQRTNKEIEVCESVGLCSKYQAAGTSSGQCAQWTESAPAVLTATTYADRDISATGLEYSGYSIPNRYGVDLLGPADVGVNQCGGPAGKTISYATPGGLRYGVCEGGSRDGFYCDPLGLVIGGTGPCGAGGKCTEAPSCTSDTEKYQCISLSCDADISRCLCVTNSDCGPTEFCGDVDKGGTKKEVCLPKIACVVNADCSSTGQNCGERRQALRLVRRGNSCTPATEAADCAAETGGQPGRCISGICAYGTDGRNPEAAFSGRLRAGNSLIAESCRAYPEVNSPFPQSVLQEQKPLLDQSTRKSGFQGASVCESDDADADGVSDCECRYSKATYEVGSSRYFRLGRGAESKEGVCTDGPLSGAPCVIGTIGPRTSGNLSCEVEGIAGTCSRLKRIESVLGLSGYCLEPDLATPVNGSDEDLACVTWYPANTLSGSLDIYNQFTSAGFTPEPGREFYCANVSTDDQRPKLKYVIGTRDKQQTVTEKNDAAYTKNDKAEGTAYNYDFSAGTTFRIPGQSCVGKHGAGRAPFNDAPQLMSFTRPELSSSGWTDWVRGGPKDTGGNTIGPAPNDLIGWYHIGTTEGTATFTVDSLTPQVYKYQLGKIILDVRAGDHDGDPAGIGENNGACVLNHCADADNVNLCNQTYGYSTDTDENRNDDGWTTIRGNLVLQETNGFKQRRSSDEGWLEATAMFDDDNTGLFTGITIEAKDNGDTGTFAIVNVLFEFIPGCTVVGKAGKADPFARLDERAVARTNRINSLGVSFVRPSLENISAGRIQGSVPQGLLTSEAYDRTAAAQCNPWGAIREFDATVLGLVTRNTSSTPGPEQCLKKTGALWNRNELWANLFPVLRDAKRFDPLSASYNLGGAAPDDLLDGRDDFSAGSFPTVLSLGERVGSKYHEGIGGISINGRQSGPVWGSGGRVSARAEFFAYADPDHMPIRRVLVDWGESGYTPNLSANNWFKNRRGYTTDGEPICAIKPGDATNAANFGVHPAACDAKGPFSYSHSYTCTSSFLTNAGNKCDPAAVPAKVSGCWSEDAHPDIRIDGGKKHCHFVPRVQVLDNWGWCNGTCTGGDANPGCFNDPDLSGSNKECNFFSSGSGNNPWAYYAGTVIVTP